MENGVEIRELESNYFFNFEKPFHLWHIMFNPFIYGT